MIPFAKVEIPLTVSNKCFTILDSGNLTNGKYVEKFEKQIAKISETDYAICTNSGTTALLLAVKHILKGKVGMQDYTWISGKETVLRNEHKPIWLDVDLKSWLVEKPQIKKADSYLLTDTFGNKVDVTTKKPTLIDCAHSFGLPFNSKYKAGIYSFAPAKTFTAGEGGAIVTNDKKLYTTLKEEVKWAGRMQEVNAVIGLDSIIKYKSILRQKKKIFDYYKDKLNRDLTFQKIKKSTYNVVGCQYYNDGTLIPNLKNKVELKKRYLIDTKLQNTNRLYHDNICLPSYPTVDYKKVARLVWEDIKYG